MISTSTRLVASLLAMFVLILTWQRTAAAQSGVWTEPTGDGAWSSGANWSGGTIADGSGNTADFSQVDVDAQAVFNLFGNDGLGNPFARNAVQLDTPRTIGNLIFGDANTGTPGGWEMYTNDLVNNILTLSGATPTITVSPLGPINTTNLVGATPVTPDLIDDVIIRPTMAGTSGFTKMGAGTLSIAGTNPNLRGTINVNEGTLRLRTGATFDFETATTAEVTRFALANGATLETQVSIGQNAALPAAAGTTVAAGATATIRNIATNSQFFANVTGGAGSTLNYVATTGGALTGTVDRDWSGFSAINFTGTAATPSQVRLRNNGGTFNANSFLNTAVNLSNMTLFTNTNSGGNTNFIGSISGDSTSTLQGGAAGSVVSYQIGNLNTDTTFAGNVTTGTGLNLFKVGSGKLTLSGTLSYTTTNNATADRRGGITRIAAGTLALTGTAAIPGGIVDGTLGNLFTTIDVRSGAALDVSGAAATYSTAPLQQVIGVGNVVGNYNHDEGVLAPGDTVSGGNTANLIATAGTLTFANNLSFAGTGQLNFDISPSLVSGNDRLEVSGASLTGTPNVKIGFLGGAAAGQYTVLNSATPLVGSTAGWTVQWEGRGAAPTLVQTANQVKLDLGTISTGNLNWRGNVDGVWNAGAAAGTANWQNTGTAASDKFFQLDNVAFRDTYDGFNAPTTTTITLNTVVFPSSVVVNSSLNYTVGGTGRITGGASFIKQGTGTFTVTTANDYAGGTTINGGILNLGATGMPGSGTITLSGGALHREAGTLANNIVVTAATASKISNNHNTSGLLLLNGSISGSGNLALENNSVGDLVLMTPPVVNGIDFGGDNSGFNGAITIGGPTPVFFRARLATSVGNNAVWDVGNNGSTLAAVVGANSTFNIGSLTGGTASTVSGHESGGGTGSSTYRIGALNTSTEFAGVIKDGRVDLNPTSFTAVTKVGTATLTLSGTNSYTGDTRVEGGTLSITNPFLADTADVFLSTGSVFNLNFAGTDTIDSLFFNNAPQAIGTWGAPGSGATFTSNLFSGTGLLQITTLGVAPILIGDYNGNGVVDAADYTTWRNNLGGVGTTLQNRDPANGAGSVSTADYDSWKAHFGQTGGAGSGGLDSAAVPEPASAMLLIVAVGMLAAVASWRRRG